MDIKERIAMIQNDDRGTAEYVLHQLLEMAMILTGRGYVSDDYTKLIGFEIGNITVSSDSYYDTVYINEQDLDTDSILKLIEELKKRLILFDKKIKTAREKLSAEIFDTTEYHQSVIGGVSSVQKPSAFGGIPGVKNHLLMHLSIMPPVCDLWFLTCPLNILRMIKDEVENTF